MKPVQINYTVYGDVEENGTTYSCFAGAPLTVAAVESLFPFEGKYHFRIKQSGSEYGMNNVEYVWRDLCNGGDDLLRSYTDDALLDVQALVLDEPSIHSFGHDEGYAAYLQQVETALQSSGLSPEDRPMRQAPQRSAAAAVKRASVTLQGITQGVQNISLESVTKGAASFWNNVKSTASQALGVSSVSDSAALENISLLHTELNTTFSDSNQRHQLLLSELWSALFPGEPYQRQGAKWKEAGFQKPDPASDVKNSGLLALQCMSYLGSRYPADTQRMISTQKENIKSHYPFAVVAVNLTLMLCDIVGIRDKRYESIPVEYLELFCDISAFYEFFCLCFLHMDSIWNLRKAVRADFAAIIGDVKSVATSVMKRSPRNIVELRQIALECGFKLP